MTITAQKIAARIAARKDERSRLFLGSALFWGIFFSCMALAGCSSAPERPEAIYTDRNMAASQLNLANSIANRGRCEDAMLIVEDAWRLALTADDPPLRIKTSIARGSILFALGRQDEAFRAWEAASQEGGESNEPVLAALARIYAIRARLALLDGGAEAGGEKAAAAEEFKARLGEEIAAVEPDALAVAAGNLTLGMAEKQMGRWAEAEAAALRALETHEKERSLEDAAYDWFLIASIRSQAGNYDSALEALWTSIHFDRRAENGFGLAASWQAMGEVQRKAGRQPESLAALRRAADIYRALGLTDRAEKLESRF